MKHESPIYTPDRDGWAYVRRGVRALGYVAAATLGGVGANAALTSSAEVGGLYQVDLRLDPSEINQVEATTSLNPVTFTPESPLLAPGITVLPHLQPTALDSFKRNGNQIGEVRPSDEDSMAALESLGRQMGLKFAAGGFGSALLYGYLINSGGARRRHGRIVAGAASGMIVAAAGVTGSAYSTYDLKEQWSIQTEGVLAEAYANRDLFDDISKQSGEVSSKVSAMLQLVNSFETSGGNERSDGGVKFLLVSDIHGMDIGPIIKDAVDQHGISAVIVPGDILNYGTVGELEAAGIPEGLESVDVPVVVVTGNHDKTAPDDEQVLKRLKEINNVVLLHPDKNGYVTVSIGGVVIGGFNDPRNGFDGQVASEVSEQESAAREFLASVPLKQLDVVVTHENIAATPINKAAAPNQSLVTINGHGHRLALNSIGKTLNIEVGSATAGGLTNPNRYNIDGKNIKEIPDQNLNSFDILTFGSNCLAEQLTRIQYTVDEPRQVLTRTIPLAQPRSELTSPRVCSPDEILVSDAHVRVDVPQKAIVAAEGAATSSPSSSPVTP